MAIPKFPTDMIEVMNLIKDPTIQNTILSVKDLKYEGYEDEQKQATQTLAFYAVMTMFVWFYALYILVVNFSKLQTWAKFTGVIGLFTNPLITILAAHSHLYTTTVIAGSITKLDGAKSLTFQQI